MSGINKKWRWILCLVVLSLGLFWSRWLVMPPPPIQQGQEAKVPAQRVAQKHVSRQVRTSPHYQSFDQLERQLQLSRWRLAGCLLRKPAFNRKAVDLTLTWTGAGELAKLDLSPNPGDEVADCFRAEVERWKVSPHPGLKPFSYRRRLEVSGP